MRGQVTVDFSKKVNVMEDNGFRLNHTMIRVKDPEASLAFYTSALGMYLLEKFDFEALKFSLYFLGFWGSLHGSVPVERGERIMWLARQSGILELTHNYGTEADDDFAGYHDGNRAPQGFGHIGVSVPDVNAACERFEQLGIEFVKRPADGSMKGLAFIKDPDGYWVEIFSSTGLRKQIMGS